jgi:ketohexokinase
MIERVRRECPQTAISVEIEKPRLELERLLQPVAVLLFSRAFIQSQRAGEEQAPPWDFLAERQRTSGAGLCVAPWGAEGAYAVSAAGEQLFAPAVPPEHLRDTLAAGDVFNAALIDGLLRDLSAADALAGANRVAGFKCGHPGIDGLIEDARQAGVLC